MFPGTPIIKKCSECSGLIIKDSLLSGNTFGAIFWTDGKMEAPMLPDYPSLVKCPHCRSPVWLDRLESLDEINHFESMNASAEDPLELDQEDYAAYFSSNNLLKPDVEKNLRFRAWWRGNDDRRRGRLSNFTEIETNNLKALAEILDESDDSERLMKAEIMRELGDFDQALELLDQTFDGDLADAVKAIRGLTQQGEAVVAALNLDE